MSTDFWASTHYKRWIVDRATLHQARAIDLDYVQDPDYLDYLAIFFANVITKLGKKLQLRQRVIATATVFFRRFYLKNAYCETDPFAVIPACIYVAAKAEESSVHIKNVISESRSLFSQTYGIKTFPSDNSKLAEMEFYLVDDLECDLVVYHPYRTLLALCKKEPASGSQDGASVFSEEEEEGETEEGEAAGIGIGSEEGPRYWGTGVGKLVLSEAALQTAWSIINDTYRSELCLIHPPHLIAIAALYLTFILHPPDRTQGGSLSASPSQESTPQPRRSSRQANTPNLPNSGTPTGSANVPSSLSKFKPPPSLPAKPSFTNLPSNPSPSTLSTSASTSSQPAGNPDPITFLAQLNVSLPLVATIAQEIISLYTLWDRYKDDGVPDASGGISISSLASGDASSRNKGKTRGRTSGIPIAVHDSPASLDSKESTASPSEPSTDATQHDRPITPAFLLQVLMSMRQERLRDLIEEGEGELLGLSLAPANPTVNPPHSIAFDQNISMNNVNLLPPPLARRMEYDVQNPMNKLFGRTMNAGYG